MISMIISSQRGLFPKHASSLPSFPLVTQGLRATFYLAHQKEKGGEGRNNIYTSPHLVFHI